uniref:protein-serine/threonine phosphatase n=1 Tax=Varanus komodoensis TaxID=61221 RepID=A0A8D2JKZ0_VARKO
MSRLFGAEPAEEAPSFFLEAPRTEKALERGAAGDLRYGLASMQGWRAHMEDAHTACPQLPDRLARWAFFAVFDGHAGGTVARFCAAHLLEHVLAAEALPGADEEDAAPGAVAAALREAFLALDRRMQALSRAEGWEPAGSTAVAVLVSPRRLYFANLGDSRALLCRAAAAAFCTEEHKPGRPRERERIENAGGTVSQQRVNGSLAVSRALGDFDYKAVAWRGPTEQPVSPEPEVSELPRRPDEDEFLLLACDGVWDAFDAAGLCAFARSRLLLSGDPQEVCERVLDAGLYKGSRDNMTCILVCFPAAPGVSQEALQTECELDAYLERRVAGSYLRTGASRGAAGHPCRLKGSAWAGGREGRPGRIWPSRQASGQVAWSSLQGPFGFSRAIADSCQPAEELSPHTDYRPPRVPLGSIFLRSRRGGGQAPANNPPPRFLRPLSCQSCTRTCCRRKRVPAWWACSKAWPQSQIPASPRAEAWPASKSRAPLPPSPPREHPAVRQPPLILWEWPGLLLREA